MEDRRLTFDADSAGYTLGRPAYPAKVFDLLEGYGTLFRGCRVLEVGPGTGQATTELLARGARVEAVELGPHLAQALRERVPDPHLQITVGDVTQLPLPLHGYDLVVAATVLHWLEPWVVLPRLHRTLRLGGTLALWWTVFADPAVTSPFQRRLDELLERHGRERSGTPAPLRVDERVSELAGAGLFDEVRVDVLPWSREATAEQVRALFATFPSTREDPALLDDVAAAVELEGGTVEQHFVTVLYTANRADPAQR